MRWIIVGLPMLLYVGYIIFMAVANDVCDCVQEWNGWWMLL